MKRGVIIILVLLQSCFEFSKHGSQDLGDGFEYYYFNNSIETANIYFNDSGIFPYQCNSVKWNDSLIFIECNQKNDQQKLFFILNKTLYQQSPQQFESIAINGPLNYDSLIKSGFFEYNQFTGGFLSINDLK
jgi:hypothetical protein